MKKITILVASAAALLTLGTGLVSASAVSTADKVTIKPKPSSPSGGSSNNNGGGSSNNNGGGSSNNNGGGSSTGTGSTGTGSTGTGSTGTGNGTLPKTGEADQIALSLAGFAGLAAAAFAAKRKFN